MPVPTLMHRLGLNPTVSTTDLAAGIGGVQVGEQGEIKFFVKNPDVRLTNRGVNRPSIGAVWERSRRVSASDQTGGDFVIARNEAKIGKRHLQLFGDTRSCAVTGNAGFPGSLNCPWLSRQ